MSDMQSMFKADSSSLVEECDRAYEMFKKYYDISEACPDNIRRIISTVKDLHDLLQESIEVLTGIHRSYPGQRCLRSRLQETERFVKKFCELHDPASDDLSDSPPRFQRKWTAPRYAFERRRAEQLLEGLQIEIKKFIQFLFVLCLHTRFARAPGIHIQHSGRLEPVASSVRAITQRLSELTYQVERRQNQAMQMDISKRKPMDFADLEQQVNREWTLLCLRAGFEDATSQPPLPDSPRNLLLSPSQIYHEMIIAHHRDTTSSPLSATFRDLAVTDKPVYSGEPTAKMPLSDQRTEVTEVSQHHVILGEPALPLHVADFEMRPRQMLKLQSWRLVDDGTQKKIIWTGLKAANSLEHAVDSQAIPYTLHSSLSGDAKRFSLTFHGFSRVLWLKDGKQKLSELRGDVTYQFVTLDASKQFQEEFRDLHLVDCFEVENIRSQWSKGRFEAVNQDLKIWRSREEDTYTLSFFANHLQEHLEFPLDWFDARLQGLPVKRAVTVSLISQSSKSWRSTLKGRLTRGNSESSKENAGSRSTMWTSVASAASSIRGSMSTISSGHSSIGPSPKRVAETVAWADKFRSITIQFSTNNTCLVAKEANEDDYARFCRLLTKVHATVES